MKTQSGGGAKPKAEETDWARAFNESAPWAYAEAIRIAQDDELRVEIFRTDEAGSWEWAISVSRPIESKGFWMDAKKTKGEARALCRQMGWKVA